MATITIKNLPESLHSALKKRAKKHGRSLNGEVLFCLNAAVSVPKVNIEETLSSLATVRSSDSARLTDDLLKSALKEGRR